MKYKNLETLEAVIYTHKQLYRKNERGITLLALIVTIVVLLILAGVTIGTLTGDNGLISKSQDARNETIGMQESTTTDRDALYGEIIENKDAYEEEEKVEINLSLEEVNNTSIRATAEATDTNNQIVSYNFYIKKMTEKDNAYTLIKKNGNLTNIAIQSNLEKDMGYRVKVVATNKDGVSNTAEEDIIIGNPVKITVKSISEPDSYPATSLITITDTVTDLDYIVMPDGEKINLKNKVTNGIYTSKATYNSTKNGPIEFKVADKLGNVRDVTYQVENVINFETEWTTTVANTTVTVPVTGTVNVYIDYGDGTGEMVTSANPTHTYANAGTYIMKISGQCNSFDYNTSTQNYLTGLKKWGILQNTKYAFGGLDSGCSKMTGSIPKPNKKSFEKINTFEYIFSNCTGLTSIDLNGSNTSNVTSMNSMFQNCSNATSINISELDTSNVKDMRYTFKDCESVNSLDVSKWNTSKVYTMVGTFQGCKTLKLLDVSSFDTKKVQSMTYMFLLCENLKSIKGLNQFNTENVTAMFAMFRKCSSLESLDLSSFNTSNVNNMQQMFNDCSSLTKLDLGTFNTSKVKNMAMMFSSCGVTELNISNFDTSNVKHMEGMFQSVKKISKLDLSNFDTSKVENMSYMFSYCDNLTEIDISSFDTSNVTNMSHMFDWSYNLAKCDVSKFDTSKVTTMNAMFRGCYKLFQINLTNFDTSNVTDMGYMFDHCEWTTSIDLSSFDTTNVTNMTNMFNRSLRLTTIYVGDKWTTQNVTSSDNIFYDCNAIVGGAGTTFDSNHIDITYARIDGGPSSTTPGYLTLKQN